MSIIAQDSFTETSTVDLNTHTANVGGGWTTFVGQIQIIANTNLIEEANAVAGNRYNMTTSPGSGPYLMSVNVVVPSMVAGLEPGLTARRSTNSGADGYEFRYDGLNSQWNLSDGTNTSILSEAWPGGTVAMSLHVEDNLVIGYVGGVEKCRLTSNVNPGSTFAGVMMLNFTGTNFQMQMSSFEIDTAASLLATPDTDTAPHLWYPVTPNDVTVQVWM